MSLKTFLILDESLFEVQSLLFQVFLEAVELLNLQSDLRITVAGTFVRVVVPTALKSGSQDRKSDRKYYRKIFTFDTGFNMKEKI